MEQKDKELKQKDKELQQRHVEFQEQMAQKDKELKQKDKELQLKHAEFQQQMAQEDKKLKQKDQELNIVQSKLKEYRALVIVGEMEFTFRSMLSDYYGLKKQNMHTVNWKDLVQRACNFDSTTADEIAKCMRAISDVRGEKMHKAEYDHIGAVTEKEMRTCLHNAYQCFEDSKFSVNGDSFLKNSQIMIEKIKEWNNGTFVLWSRK